MKKGIFSGVLVLFVSVLLAGNFTAGNIVVVRVGDGSAALSNASQAVFLDEYTTGGTLVQSVPLPTSASGNNHILTMSGSATSEGSLTLSANGAYLVLAGYDAAPGLVSVANDSVTNRTIAIVGANGVANTSTGYLAGTAYKKNNIRGACTVDGSAFWTSGAGTSSTGGVWYTAAGGFTNSGVQVSSAISSARVVNIFDNQLYTSSASSSYHGVNAVGTGLPTASGQTTTNLSGMPGTDTASSSYGYYFLDMDAGVSGLDVVYVCDDRSNGGIYKYSLVGGNWVGNGNIPTSNAIRGITGKATGNIASLYITGQAGLFSFTDSSGYNQTITGSFTQLATPATNTVIRGVAFAPGLTSVSNELNLTQKFDVYSSGSAIVVNALLNKITRCQTVVYDITGNKVYTSGSENVATVDLQIPSASLSAGCYIVSIVTEEGTTSRKVMVSR